MDFFTVVMTIAAFVLGWIVGRRDIHESFRARVQDDNWVIEDLQAQLAEATGTKDGASGSTEEPIDSN